MYGGACGRKWDRKVSVVTIERKNGYGMSGNRAAEIGGWSGWGSGRGKDYKNGEEVEKGEMAQ